MFVLRADYGGYGGYEGGYGARAAPRGKGTALRHSLRCLHALAELSPAMRTEHSGSLRSLLHFTILSGRCYSKCQILRARSHVRILK